MTALAAAVTESPLKLPLPSRWLAATMSVTEVLLIWAGLTGPRPVEQPKAKRRRKAKRKPRAPRPSNVVRLPTAA